jgi:hypothetical protein
VAQPGSEATVESNICGTFTAQQDRCIDTQHVPLNDSQRAAVLGLRGGFDIIHGKYHTTAVLISCIVHNTMMQYHTC